MTKYTERINRFTENKDTPIIATYGNDQNKERYCRYCNHLLHTIRDSSGQNVNQYCSNCSISYPDEETENLRSKSKIITPDNFDNSKNPLSSPLPEPELRRKKVTIKGGLAEWQRKGVKITSYSEGAVETWQY